MKKFIAFLLTIVILSSMCTAFADNSTFSYIPGGEDKTPLDELDIDNYVKVVVTDIYDEVKAKIDDTSYRRQFADQNRVEYEKDRTTGMIRRIVLPRNTYDNLYNEYFYYDKDENLVFVHYDGAFDNEDIGSHRMYVYDGTMVFWKQTPAGATNSIRHRMEKTDEYLDLQENILEQSAELMKIVKGK